MISAGAGCSPIITNPLPATSQSEKSGIYDGRRWVPDIGNLQVMELCKALADQLIVYALTLPDEHQRTTFLDCCRKWQVRRNRETILKDAQSVYTIAVSSFDRNRYAFNCNNCTLNLNSGEAKPYNSGDFITKISDVIYDPNARSERWERFIDEITGGDKDKASFLQRAFGYALSGDTSHECLFIHLGSNTPPLWGVPLGEYLAVSAARKFILYGATTRNGKGSLYPQIKFYGGMNVCKHQQLMRRFWRGSKN
jgi:phage/plasmid-associated DNA primase